MKKALLLFLTGVSLSLNALAQNHKDIDLQEEQDNPSRSIRIIPKAYQENAIIYINLPNTTTYTTVAIIQKTTGKQVYSMIHVNTDTIQIDLNIDNKGEYTIELNTNNIIYRGDFIL